MRCLAMVGTLILLVTSAAVGAENLVANPSAEEAAANGMPKGWGKYVGAGGVRLAVTTDEKHSGKSAASLELDKWHTPKDAQDSPENRSVSGAMILAENNGYRVRAPCHASPARGTPFPSGIKGRSPRPSNVTGWPSEKAESASGSPSRSARSPCDPASNGSSVPVASASPQRSSGSLC